MMSLTLAVLIQASAAATAADDYHAAKHRAETSGQALVVLVGADWCPGCRTMKQTVIPQAKRQGMLKHVHFAHVNTDQQSQLAGKLMRGRSIPQLIMFRKTDKGWKRDQVVGAQSMDELARFLEPAKALAAKPKAETSTVQADTGEVHKTSSGGN
jgi:thioredoxin-like negative regulator of GroEL